MFQYLTAAALAISVAGWAVPASADDPTPEQCTCDLKPPELDNGAYVTNATACWESPKPDHQWCDITVEALRGGDRYQAIIDAFTKYQGAPKELTEFMQSKALQALDMMEGPSNKEYVAKMSSLVPDFFPKNDERIADCVSRFLESRKSGKAPEPIKAENFLCEIGERSGWLQMTFVVNGSTLVFKLAPHG
jgi:hypothetical protein